MSLLRTAAFFAVLCAVAIVAIQPQPQAEAQAPLGPPGWPTFRQRLMTENLALFVYSADDGNWLESRISRYFYWNVISKKAIFVPHDNRDNRWYYNNGVVKRFVCDSGGPPTTEPWGPIPAQMWAEVRSGFANSTLTYDSQCVKVEPPSWSNGLVITFCFAVASWREFNTVGEDLTNIFLEKNGLKYSMNIQDYRWGRPIPAALTEEAGVCEMVPESFVGDLAEPPPEQY